MFQLFKTYSIQTLNSAVLFIQDLKLGHYMKIPPRITFMGESTLRYFIACSQFLDVIPAQFKWLPS